MLFAKAYSGMKGAAARALILGVCGLGLAGCDTLSSLNPFTRLIVQGVVILVAMSAFQILKQRSAA